MNFEHSDLPIESDLPKLIRDKIPQIIMKNEGKKAIVRVAKNDKEYLSFILKKIIEEAVEIQGCNNNKDFINEISDLEELISVLMRLNNIKRNEIEKTKKAKVMKNGGFSKRYIFEGKE